MEHHIRHEYEEVLDEVLLKHPTINPVFTLSSSERPPSALSNPESSASCSSERETEGTKAREPPKRKKTPTARNEIVVGVFKQSVSDQKEEWRKRDEMHIEKMRVMTSLANVLKDMRDK